MNVRLSRRRPLALLLVAGALGVLIGAGGLVAARTQVTRLRFELMKLQEARGELRESVEKLRIEAAALAAPDRLESRARRLGLRYPEPGQVITLDLSPPETKLVAGGARP